MTFDRKHMNLEEGISCLHLITYRDANGEAPIGPGGVYIGNRMCFITLYDENLYTNGSANSPPVTLTGGVVLHMAIYSKRDPLTYNMGEGNVSDAGIG